VGGLDHGRHASNQAPRIDSCWSQSASVSAASSSSAENTATVARRRVACMSAMVKRPDVYLELNGSCYFFEHRRVGEFVVNDDGQDAFWTSKS